MSTLTTVRTAALPRVNLLPPEIEEARQFRKTQFGLAAAVAASLVVVAGLFVMANGAVSSANSDLQTSQASGAKLQADAAKYSDVPAVYARVAAAKAQLSLAMGQEVRWSFFLNDLSLKTPSKVWLTEMTVTQLDPSAAVAAGPTAGATYINPGIGNVQFHGYAKAHNDVASWLDSLARQKGYAQPYFTNSTKEKISDVTVVTFDSKVSITEDALSKRYTQKAGS
jgi:Tfp pilus assembly protein PilN